MTGEESPIVKKLRDYYKKLLQRTSSMNDADRRHIILDLASIVRSTLPEVFPRLGRGWFSKMLWRLKDAGEMNAELFNALDALRVVYNRVKSENYIPTEPEAKATLQIFESFIEWVGAKERVCAMPEARITDIWCEFDVWDDDEEGMEILVDFEVYNFWDRTGEIIVYFHYDDVDWDQPHHIEDSCGRVAVRDEFKPGYARTIYKEFSLFLPYGWLDYALYGPGEYDLKFNVQILDDNRNVLAERWYYFVYECV